MEHRFRTAEEAVHALLPESPMFVYRKHALESSVRCFKTGFNGDILYAVKTNPSPEILQDLYAAGIRSYDVASEAEARIVRQTLGKDALMYFMHPVKSRRAIREAYHTHNIRHFSLDGEDELEKILHETGRAADLGLMIRIAIPNSYAKLALCEKFGACRDMTIRLLRKARPIAKELGICFHVGSQCMHPESYTIAMQEAASMVAESGIELDILDIGGGFPSIYPGMEPPPMQEYFDTIHASFARTFPNKIRPRLIAEPGRALVAESGSLIVRVERRKHHALYINDGTYGALFDAGIPRFIFPVKHILPESDNTPTHIEASAPFRFFGPTCDSLDVMEGPFYLPDHIKEGDYIEIGQLGAYARTMITGFNGFYPDDMLIYTEDKPLMVMPTESCSSSVTGCHES